MTLFKTTGLTMLIVGLSACAIPDNARTGLRPLDEKNALVTFTDGPFDGPASHRLMYADPEQREEYALFKSSGRIAEVVYLTTRHLHMNNLSLDNWGTLGDMISSWNFTRSGVELDAEAFLYDAGWIEFWVKSFTLRNSGQKCAGFQGEWDGRADDPEQRPSKMIFGYFCEKPGAALNRGDMEKRVQEVGVRGISVKLTGDIAQVAAVPKAPSQAELKSAVQRGSYGTPEFPYIRARNYNAGECRGQVPCS